MSLVEHLVLPQLPTALTNNTFVDLPGHDIYPSFEIKVVYVIPTELDISKFKDALSRVLQLCPHAAGQLRSTDGRWFIELTNTGVPVYVDLAPGMNLSSFIDGEWVVQRSMLPLLPIDANSVGANGAPLLRFKLTFFDRETCIGVCWNHSLGDGSMVCRYMHMISQFYQGLPLPYAAPTFEKCHFPAPTPDMVAELSSRMPLYQFDEPDEAANSKSQCDIAEVRWRFSLHELQELRSALSSGKQNEKPLSKLDCLTAYLVAVLNSHSSKPIRMMLKFASYRHMKASFVKETVAGNSFLPIPASIPEDMAGVASAIRDAVAHTRDLDFLYMLESWKSEYMLKAANTGNWHPYMFKRGELRVNGLTFDWCSAHFGCPDGTRFHLNALYMGGLRYLKSNPVKGVDGTWRTPDSVDVSLGVPADQKPKIMETLARGVRYMLDLERSRLSGRV